MCHVWQVGDNCWVAGIDCEVSSPASVERLADAAQSQMGKIDVWVNNAGYSGTFKVRTVGQWLCCDVWEFVTLWSRHCLAI